MDFPHCSNQLYFHKLAKVKNRIKCVGRVILEPKLRESLPKPDTDREYFQILAQES